MKSISSNLTEHLSKLLNIPLVKNVHLVVLGYMLHIFQYHSLYERWTDTSHKHGSGLGITPGKSDPQPEFSEKYEGEHLGSTSYKQNDCAWNVCL